MFTQFENHIKQKLNGDRNVKVWLTGSANGEENFVHVYIEHDDGFVRVDETIVDGEVVIDAIWRAVDLVLAHEEIKPILL